MSSAIDVKSFMVTLDCPDALELAQFYAQLLGWRVDFDPEDPEWADAIPPDDAPQSFALSFQQIDHYRAPEWPEGEIPQQMHFDLYVDSLEEAAEAAEAAGARRHDIQPSETGSYIVLTDPAGHPFCLCQS